MERSSVVRVYQILGAQLRQHRNKAGLAQEDVAVELGIDRRYYGRMESGQTKISVVRLLDICRIIQADPAVLVAHLAEVLRHEG